MKYKFLYRMLNSKYSVMAFESTSDVLSEGVYSEVYGYLYKFKSERVTLECSCLDSIIDALLSESNNILSADVNKLFVTVKKILSRSSVEDFRVFFLFYIYLDYVLVDLGTPSSEIEKINIKVDTNVLATLHYLSSTFCILAGGILYKPVKVNNSFLTIGLELDKIFDINYNGFIYNSEGTEKKLSDTGVMVKFTNKLFNKSKSPILYKGLRDYYDSLLNLCNALFLEGFCKSLYGKISIDDFKISTVLLMHSLDWFNSGDSPLSEHRIERNFIETFYSRKVMIPSGGVVMSIEETRGDVLLLESDDDTMGYSIFTMDRCEEVGITSCNFIFLSFRESTIRRPLGFVKYMMDVYRTIDKIPDKGFLSVPVRYDVSGTKVSVDLILTSMGELGDYEVYSPDYWKYRGKFNTSGSSEPNLTDSFIKKRITINPFKRRLPRGHARSQSAEEKARRMCIKLEEDETIVSGFEKWQRSHSF